MKKQVRAVARPDRKRQVSRPKTDKTTQANAVLKRTDKAIQKLDRDSYVAPEDLRIPFSV